MDDAWMGSAWRRAVERWPAIAQAEVDALQHARSFEVDPSATASAREDVMLAAACLAGHRAALSVFEREVLGGVGPAIARIDRRHDLADEVRQLLRTRLLVGPPPRLFAYKARGPLASWVKVAAIRTAVDLGRKEQVQAKVADALGRRLVEVAADAPDVAVLRSSQHQAFSAALRAACADVSPRDRAVLKMQFLDGVGIDRIAAAYDVHRSTAARWVHRATEALQRCAAKRLGAASQLRPSEVQSLGRVLQSQLSVSFGALRVTS
ncbi:MAG: helix-turn-helix domain-containing protein [Myxococcota bacterium]